MTYNITGKGVNLVQQSLEEVKRFIYTKLDNKQGKMVYMRLLKLNDIGFIGLKGGHYIVCLRRV